MRKLLFPVYKESKKMIILYRCLKRALITQKRTDHVYRSDGGVSMKIRGITPSKEKRFKNGHNDALGSSCEIYTLIETAKANGWNPFKYLTRVFTQADQMNPADDWGQLLPWNLAP
jgi:hypothetical protein